MCFILTRKPLPKEGGWAPGPLTVGKCGSAVVGYSSDFWSHRCKTFHSSAFYLFLFPTSCLLLHGLAQFCSVFSTFSNLTQFISAGYLEAFFSSYIKDPLLNFPSVLGPPTWHWVPHPHPLLSAFQVSHLKWAFSGVFKGNENSFEKIQALA